jgi:hypothetical protein
VCFIIPPDRWIHCEWSHVAVSQVDEPAVIGKPAADQFVLSGLGWQVKMLPNERWLFFNTTCSIAAHGEPCGFARRAAEHHPSTSAKECGCRLDRQHGRVR